jgi:hypothetical protein
MLNKNFGRIGLLKNLFSNRNYHRCEYISSFGTNILNNPYKYGEEVAILYCMQASRSPISTSPQLTYNKKSLFLCTILRTRSWV